MSTLSSFWYHAVLSGCALLTCDVGSADNNPFKLKIKRLNDRVTRWSSVT
ncbi:hypothetical protein PC116_g4057 [Phytophthora cactorum]|nr:hypothetical protein PC114_g2201 [Phytophthora cactorum]KAG4248205.1 hypothetical protein PC116_g4057 [Phytophthora cactorum]